jgi:excisionase family DNA binding protein
LPEAASYLGVSVTTLKGLVARGVVPRVLVPGGRGYDLRRTLLDRDDLDRLIESWRARGA